MPLDENEEVAKVEINGEMFDRVSIVTRMTGTHTGDGPDILTLEGKDYKPSGRKVIFPLEWWALTINQKIKRQIVSLEVSTLR